MQQIPMIDLFAGAGGMTQGFVREGFSPVLAVEWDKAAAATYAANFGEAHVRAGDIADIPTDDIPLARVIIGGPPCQGFSNLGLKNLNDPRNQLWREYMRFVQAANPEVFVIENVDRFAKSPEYQMLLHETVDGALQDYELTVSVLNAADYGVAQRRKRTIIIGSRIGKIEMPAATHTNDVAANPELAPWRVLEDVISDLPLEPATTELPVRTISLFGEQFKGPFSDRELHFGRNPRPASLERYSMVPPGGGRFDLPPRMLPRCWREKPTGTTDVMGRAQWDKPSVTIRTEFFKPEKGQYLHPQWVASSVLDPETHKPVGDPARTANRVITHLEAAIIQDFPRDYSWVGSKTEIARQIGNAVPGKLAQAIAKQLRRHLESLDVEAEGRK